MINPHIEGAAKEAAAFIDNHKGENTVLLDISSQSGWTDYFIISTIRSSGHMRGLIRELKDFLVSKELPITHKHKKIADDDWILIDCGNIVIHLMSEEVRSFYDLERLWYNANIIDYAS